MKVLFVAIARGGSKGVPQKNLKKISGLELVAFKIISGIKSKYCSRLILSTDDAMIASVGKRYGAEVPFLRPPHLATDEASSDDVLLHAMEFVQFNSPHVTYDAVMLLEAATPLAVADDNDNAIKMMASTNANMVVGM
jgi:CMP-N,N'-diacetyllegionaminic acid synthase